MRNMLLVMLNTLRVTFRKKFAPVVYLVLPVGGVLLALVMMSGGQSKPITVGVVDESRGPLSSALVRSIDSWGNYRTTPVEAARLNALLVNGKLDCGLVIPAGFDRGALEGAVPPLRLVSIKGQAVTAWLQSFLSQFSAGLSELAAASGGNAARFQALVSGALSSGSRLDVQPLPDSSRGKNVTLTSMGFLIMFIMLGTGLTSQLVLTEKRNRTYQRVCSAPVLPREYIAGNGAAGLLIVVAQIVAVIVLLRAVLHVQTFVPDLLLFAVLFCFGLVSVALGLVISSFARSSEIANTLSTLILTPSCMLAGCFWPISLMPAFVRRIALFLPQRWVLDSVQRAQGGAGLAGIAPDLAVLLAFAVALVVVAIYGFRRAESTAEFA